MSVAIKVENLSKAYQLGDTSATLSTRIDIGTISRDLERYWAKIRGKEDPFLRIGETNDSSKKGESLCDFLIGKKNDNIIVKIMLRQYGY